MEMTKEQAWVASRVDHTNLSPDMTTKDVEVLYREALQCGCASICIPSSMVNWATYIGAALEKGSEPSVKICTVIGFPFGYGTTESKQEEIRSVAGLADEVDIVINPIWAKMHRFDEIKSELVILSSLAKRNNIETVKVIVETCRLDEEAKRELCRICMEIYDIDYIKTSTGFGSAGANIEDVKMWWNMITQRGSHLKIKASGGIRTVEQAAEFLRAGASRIGASKVVQEILSKQEG